MARKRRQRIIWPRFLTFLAVCGLLIGGLIYGGTRIFARAKARWKLALQKRRKKTENRRLHALGMQPLSVST